MQYIPTELNKLIYNFIPFEIIKFVDKKAYNAYLQSYYPKNIDHWKPLKVYDSEKPDINYFTFKPWKSVGNQ